MSAFTDKAWQGSDRLVIGIDIGTTFSAVSYALLTEGVAPSITRVDEWPALPKNKGLVKIPSLLYYNKERKVTKIGAEASSPKGKKEAEEHQWDLVQNFKLHLHPEELRFKDYLQTDELPEGVTLKQIYTDFVSYLWTQTTLYIKERVPDAGDLLDDEIDFVIAHPNAWGIKEQGFLRDVAIDAGLVHPDEAHEYIHFVTESEASVHFCISRQEFSRKLKSGMKIVVCDAGGSTIDTTAYIVDATEPEIDLREARGSSCVQAGGIYVNEEVQKYLRSALVDPSVKSDVVDGWVDNALNDLEYNVKPDFGRPNFDCSFTVDRKSCNNSKLNIKQGILKVEPKTMGSFFNPSLLQIRLSLQVQMFKLDPEYILLVGGYGESPYLRSKLKEGLKSANTQLILVDDGTAKAVSDGAVIWKCNRRVKSRVTRHSYGIAISQVYDAENELHKGRRPVRWLDGIERVPNGWKALVEKGTAVQDDILASFMRLYPNLEQAKKELARYSLEIWSFDGVPQGPPFLKSLEGTPSEGYEHVCTIYADLSDIVPSSQHIKTPSGTSYHKVSFNVGLTFGDTEISAYIQWMESDIEKRGSAVLIPNSVLVES